jgi:Uma2 family endonuclease
MTVELSDRIEMPDSRAQNLDELFELLEEMPVPEGFKAEIVEGAIIMSPQRDNHWDIIADMYDQLRTRFPRRRLKSDVRIDYPGNLNGFASDLVLLKEGAEKPAGKSWRYQDVLLVVEVISRGTRQNDYVPKKKAYADAKVPAYVIVDPYAGKCHCFTHPKDDEYRGELTTDFGEDIDLTGTDLELVLSTQDIDRE